MHFKTILIENSLAGTYKAQTLGCDEVTAEPYGVVYEAAGTSDSSYGFTGEMEDPSGLIHLRARYYMPEIGRFISKARWVFHLARYHGRAVSVIRCH